MIYRADALLTPAGRPLPGGWLQVEDGRIAALGPGTELPAGAPLNSLDGCVILPGLINAHCHLELSSLQDRLTSGKPFPAWVAELRGLTEKFTPEDYRASARVGIRKLLEGGATAVVDVGNTGEALPALAESALRSFALVEVLGLDPAVAEERLEAAAARAAAFPDTDLFRAGIAPHAAYSCSADLLARARRFADEKKLPFTIHASESREEAELFASGSGPLEEFCRRIFPGAPEHRGATPVQWLEREGLLPDGALLAHGNTLNDADIEILLKRRATVVHCPSSHAFFGHPPFAFAKLRHRGVPVCLGTDSLASGKSLSMIDQIRLFRRNFPQVTAGEALKMASETAARALGWGDEIGRLIPGLRADFIAVRPAGLPATGRSEVCEAVLDSESKVVLAVVGGREVVL